MIFILQIALALVVAWFMILVIVAMFEVLWYMLLACFGVATVGAVCAALWLIAGSV